MVKNEKVERPIVIEALHKSFGDQPVLNGIDLTVEKGETLAVLGRSGTGKSVLLKLIIGLQAPDSGSIRIHGKEIAGLALEELNELRKKVGFLFQYAALYDSLTVGENVAFPLKRHAALSAAERKERVRELLASVGMEQDLEKMPSKISGGMQKLVGLARALALEPDVLLFDEPTAGLDPITAREIGELILRLQEQAKRACVMVTHDIPTAKTVADRIAFLQEGNIVVEGTFEDLRQSPDQFVAQFMRDAS
jgi:phospholipid/cholesterol/gamma-HCH transport system ATP-binding protein